jgi:hypothetical protein
MRFDFCQKQVSNRKVDKDMVLRSFMDPHQFYADPGSGPDFYFDADLVSGPDSDPTFHFDADPVLVPI